MDVLIQTRGAGSGLGWVRSGLRLFLRQPLLMIVMVALGPLIEWSLALLPLVGTALALMLVPAMSIGMLAVCRAIDLGELPGLACYLQALRDPSARLRLIKVGVLYAIAIGALGSLWASLPADPPEAGRPASIASAPAAATATPAASNPVPVPATAPGANTAAASVPAAGPSSVTPETPTAAMSPGRLLLAGFFLLAILPVEMCLWFAPALIAWHGMPAGKALFFSFFACWRNRLPMIVYLLALFGLIFLGVVLFGALIGLLGLQQNVALYAMAPLPLALLAISRACALAMYADVVVTPSPAGEI